ncbi:MAG: NUDIX domain-containing protein [Patescibacteria group bacterium]
MMQTEVSHAGGFVVRKSPAGEREALVIKRDAQQKKYFLPNSRVEEGESEISAARREVLEETDVEDLTLIADLGVVRRNGVNDQGRRYLKTIRYFLYTSQDKGTSGWESKGITDRKFFCSWIPIALAGQEIQFPQEAGLSATALTFL